MLNFNRFVGGLHWNSVTPGVRLSYLPHSFKWGGRGGFPKNLVSQVSMFLIINLLTITNAYATTDKNIYKQEYYKQLDYSVDQTNCLVALIHQENRTWDTQAKNGSHHGLPQGKSKYLAKATYTQQITWHIKYLKSRYGTDRFGVANACGALSHWLMKGWH